MKSYSLLLTLALLLALTLVTRAQTSLVTCRQASSDKKSCLQCNMNYHLFEGQCYVDIPSCTSYVFGSICRQCKNGLILVNNECCDRVCMSKIYNQEQHQAKVSQNKEEVLRKAEVDGLERSIAMITKNSIKVGQNYDIITSKCQKYEKIFRYYVELEIDSKNYTAINDYDIVTGESVFVTLSPVGEEFKNEVTITEENIHGNPVYEQGYNHVFQKYGLQLFQNDFSHMSATKLGKSTMLKLVFLGSSVGQIISVMVTPELQTYVLWKEEKKNVTEIKEAVDSIKKIEVLSKQESFKQVFAEVLTTKGFNSTETQVIDIIALSPSEYTIFFIHRILKLRYKAQASINVKTGIVSIKKVEEVFSTKLQEMKVPEAMEIKVITKQLLTKSVEAKEVSDYLFKLRPSFRPNNVETIKIETGVEVSKILVMTKKDNKEYRISVLKDLKTLQMQVIDEGYVVEEHAAATVITQNKDNTTTITTNKIDVTTTEVKVVLETLVQNKIKVSATQIESLQYTVGPKSIEYVVVIKDTTGQPFKQVTIVQDKTTNTTVITDETTISQEIKITRPKLPVVNVVPVSDYYKTEVKELMSQVQTKVSQEVAISKITKIEYTNTTEATKFHFTAENIKGETVVITAIQAKGQTSIQVINVQSDVTSTQQTHVETKTVKMVTEYGVKVDYTNNKEIILSNQNVNIAITQITSQHTQLANFQVVSVQTKTYVQYQEQVLVMTNGNRTVQVVGRIEQQSHRYQMVETKDIAITATAPVIIQTTVPSVIYQTARQDSITLTYSEKVLTEKYKMLKNKIPTSTIIESFSTVDVITYNFEVGTKKFIAVVQYDKVIKENTKIIEMGPVEITVAVKVDQSIVDGKTITVSNSVEEIQAENSQTKTVMGKILIEYPLLKKCNITEITLIQSGYSNVFEFTYTSNITKQETTVTVRTDVDGKTITIENLQTTQIGESVFIAPIPTVVFTKEDFTSVVAQQIVQVVSTKVKVDNITSIVVETYPSYTLNKITVESSGQVIQVTVMETNGVKEVIAVRTTEQTTTSSSSVNITKPITSTSVDQNGNTVIKTTDIEVIKTLKEVTIAVSEIIAAQPQVSTWTTTAVVKIDYGTAEQISVTMQSTTSTETLKSTLIYNEVTNTVKLISVKTYDQTEVLTTTQEVFESSTTPIYPITTIPDVLIATQIKTDIQLQTVVTTIQKSDKLFVNILPQNTQIQVLSETVTQYTVVMQVQGKEKQVVVLFDSTTNVVTEVSSNWIDISVKPYYLTETSTSSGTIITSNNVQQLVTSHTELTSVLEYSSQWITINPTWVNIIKIQIEPSLISGTTIFKIETTDNVSNQVIEVSYSETTKQSVVINLAVTAITVVYPKPTHIVEVNVATETVQVKNTLTTIQQSNIATLQHVKEVISIKKEQSQHYEKIYAEVIDTSNNVIKVTLLTQEGQATQVINVESNATATVISNQVISQVESVDINGNVVKEISGTVLISKNIATSTTLQAVITQNQIYQSYVAVSAQTIDYVAVQQVTLWLSNTTTGQTVQVTSFYNVTSNTASVVSVEPVPAPVEAPVEGSRGEEGYEVTSSTSSTETTQTKPSYPTTTIPKIVFTEVAKSDKVLSSVVATIKQSSNIYINVLPTTTEIQQLSNTTIKYTLVMETATTKEQIVVIYNTQTAISQTISVKALPEVIDRTYIQQVTLQTGQIQYTSNNYTTLTTTFQDLKYVMETVQQTVTGVKVENTVVSVVAKDSVNSYVIETVQNQQKVTIQINYDVASNKTYVTNFQSIQVEVSVPLAPVFVSQVLNIKQRSHLLEMITSSEHTILRNIVNIISSQTVSYAMYNETILEVQTSNNVNHYIKLIHNFTEQTPKVVYVAPVQPQPTTPSGEGAPAGGQGAPTGGQGAPTGGEGAPSGGEGAPTGGQGAPEGGEGAPAGGQGTTPSGGEGAPTSAEGPAEQTSTTTDKNGNVVTESTDKAVIEKMTYTATLLTEVVKEFPTAEEYSVKYIKTVTYGNVIEITAKLESTVESQLDIKTIAFYDLTTKKTEVVSVQQIDILSQTTVQTSTAVYPTVVVSDSAVNVLAVKDVGFKTVLTTLQQSSQIYKSAVAVSTEVQQVSETVTKYNVVIEVAGKKEEKVYIYDSTTKKVELFASVVIPAVIKPVVTVERTINEQKTVISNQIESIQVSYPETTTVLSVLKKEIPNVKIDAVVVVPESNSSSVTFISTSTTGKEFVVNKYLYSEQTTTKVAQETVKISEIVAPKPIYTVKVAPTVITTISAIESEIIKIINVDVSQSLQIEKIQEVKVSKQTNTQIYYITSLDASNNTVKIEISYNPTTNQAIVLDSSTYVNAKVQKNITITQGVSGVVETISSNTASITQGKEYQLISEFIAKNHAEIQNATAVLSSTEKYQRSVIKTILYQLENGSYVQATYLCDQRTQSTVELAFTPVQISLISDFQLPIKKETSVYTAEKITEVMTSQPAVIKTMTSIIKVDSTLANLTPILVQVEEFATSIIVTTVFQTKNSDSRIMNCYSKETNESKVIDYSKIQKKIEEFTVTETINHYNQKTVFTDNATALIATSKEYTAVISVVEELIPAVKGKVIKAIQTTNKTSGTSFQVVYVENGVIQQANLFSDKTTNVISLISSSSTQVAERVTAIVNTRTVQTQTTLNLAAIDSIEIVNIKDTVISDYPTTFDSSSTVISGTVVDEGFVLTYELTMTSTDQVTRKVKITKEKSTNKIFVQDIKSVAVKEVKSITTTVQTNSYGNIQFISNNQVQIRQSKEIQTVIRNILIQKPQISTLSVLSVKTVTIGHLVETIIMFGGEYKPGVQITTIQNTQTHEINIVNSKVFSSSIKSINAEILPVIEIQTIPIHALSAFIRKFKELKILLNVIEKAGTVTSLSVQTFEEVKKYTVIVETKTGVKLQQIYLTNKTTFTNQLIQSVEIPAVVESVVLKTFVNSHNQVVTVSNNLQQVSIRIPEVNTAIIEIKNKYSIDASSTVQLIESKGTTTKEIKIVTVAAETQVKTVFTCMVTGNQTTIVDVQTPQLPEITVPAPIQTTVTSTSSQTISVEQKKLIVDTVFSNTVIKQNFPTHTVQHIKDTSTSFVTSYEVTVQNIKGETANITLIQVEDQPLKIVNLVTESSIAVVKQESVTTTTTVNSITGNKIVTTNDITLIKSDVVIKQLSHTVVAQIPELLGYTVSSVTTTSYNQMTETELVYTSENQLTVKVTVLLNTTTNQATVVNTQTVTEGNTTTTSTQNIPSSAIVVAIKRWPEVKEMISSIKTIVASANVETIVVKEMEDIKIYTAVVKIAEVTESKTQFVYVFNKTTKEIEQIDRGVVPLEVKTITTETKVGQFGQTVIKTNDIATITVTYPSVSLVFTEVQAKYGITVSTTTQSIEIVEQGSTTQYKLITEVNGKLGEITVIKHNNEITVLGLDLVIQTTTEQTQTSEVSQTTISGESVVTQNISIKSEVATLLNTTIHSSAIESIKDNTIVCITATETLLSTVYTVTTKDSTNQIQNVTIAVTADQQISILHVTEVQQQTAQAAVVTIQTQTIKQVSQTTGETTTITNQHQQVIQQTTTITPQIIKFVPEVVHLEAISIKTTQSGELAWSTIVYGHQQNISEERTVLQISTVVNTTDSTVTVLESRNVTIAANVTAMPQTHIYNIPAVAINTASNQLVEVKHVINEVTKTYKKEQIVSIEMEVFGESQKILTVVVVGTEKTTLSYIYNKTTEQVTFVEDVKVPEVIQSSVFSQETTKFGETVTITNNVTQIITAIPVVQTGIKFIYEKYPVTNVETVASIKVIEYPNEYTITFTSQIEVNNQLSVVVSVDKTNQEVTFISTYTQNDLIATQSIQQTSTTTVQAQTSVETVSTNSTEVTNIVHFIESTPSLPVSGIKTVLHAQQTTTLYGSNIVTIIAITDKNVKIEAEVTVTASGSITVNDFVVLEQAQVSINTVTEFSVDVITGGKVTVTNNPTVIASSSILTTVSQEVTSISGMSNTIMTESSSTEYVGTVKVVSIFVDQNTHEAIQVVSIYDKSTSQVQVIDSRVTTTITTDIKKEVFTSTEIATVQIQKPEVKKVVTYIETHYPKYASQTLETLIVESLQQVEIVTVIFESTLDVQTQVVTVYNRTTGTVEVIESSVIPANITSYYFEEKINEIGEQVILSNSVIEIEHRVETATLITEYISTSTHITKEQIQTIQVVQTPTFHEYTIIVETTQGVVQQQQFLVNLQTKVITHLDKQTVTQETAIFTPIKPVVTEMTIHNVEVKDVVDQIIDNTQIGLNNVESIISITKEEASKVDKFEIEYATTDNHVSKLVVTANKTDHKILIVDERQVTVDFVSTESTVVKQTIDEVTKTAVTVYPSVETFKLDIDSKEISTYIEKNIPESIKYTVESVRKQIVGSVVQFEVLLKSNNTAPMQITLAKDNVNKNIIVLENRKITEKVEISILDCSVEAPVKLEVSEIEKENIKVLSKLGLVRDIKEYSEVKTEEINSNEQLLQAVNDVKTTYSALLSSSVIIKTLVKKSLEHDSFKVFYKVKDHIYEASVQINPITGVSTLTEFIKVGTQGSTKSEINLGTDLCLGYNQIQDSSLDGNLDFVVNYLKQKYDSLKDASVIESWQLTLANGRINYKLMFKKDSTTSKYIVYYEPEYKRVVEIKGSIFSIGDEFKYLPTEDQVNNPYFRKLDSTIKQAEDKISSATVLHTESKDDGQTIQFRTVYSTKEGKTYRSIASIDKQNQMVNEGVLSEIIQVPIESKRTSTSECNNKQAKLDIHDIGKNAYFTECYKYVQAKYADDLGNAQLLGAGEESKFNTFVYVFYFVIDQKKIITLTVDFNPLTQAINVLSAPETISLLSDYTPIRLDHKLNSVRNWLKENNPDLTNSVLVASLAKKFYFGTLYKVVFKLANKYLVYIVYMDCVTKEMKLYDTQELDSYSSVTTTTTTGSSGEGTTAGEGAGEGAGAGEGQGVAVGEPAPVDPLADLSLQMPARQYKLKGFPRPQMHVPLIN